MANSEVNSARKHNYNCMLDNGIYQQVNNYMFRPIAAIFRLLQFFFEECHVYLYILSKIITKLLQRVSYIYIY